MYLCSTRLPASPGVKLQPMKMVVRGERFDTIGYYWTLMGAAPNFISALHLNSFQLT